MIAAGSNYFCECGWENSASCKLEVGGGFTLPFLREYKWAGFTDWSLSTIEEQVMLLKRKETRWGQTFPKPHGYMKAITSTKCRASRSTISS